MPRSNSLPGKVNFTVKQGDTFRRAFTFVVSGTITPIDLTGAVISIQLRDRVGGVLFEEWMSGAEITVGGVGNNTATLSTDIAWEGKYKYEFEVVYPTGVTKTYLEGTITSKAEVNE